MSSIKKLLLCLVMFISTETIACTCGRIPILSNYQLSEFIASAKILKVEKSNDEDYHDINIDLMKVYKGVNITKLKVRSLYGSSCSFLPSVNTTWLIFASKDDRGFLSFGFCSGSEQIHPDVKIITYPNSGKKHLDLKLEVLSFLKKSKISAINQFNLKMNDFNISQDGLPGYTERNRFALYEIAVNQDLSIGNIRTLKGFNNKDLSKELIGRLRDKLKIDTENVNAIPEKTKIVLAYFYHSAEGGRPSFVSNGDYAWYR